MDDWIIGLVERLTNGRPYASGNPFIQ